MKSKEGWWHQISACLQKHTQTESDFRASLKEREKKEASAFTDQTPINTQDEIEVNTSNVFDGSMIEELTVESGSSFLLNSVRKILAHILVHDSVRKRD